MAASLLVAAESATAGNSAANHQDWLVISVAQYAADWAQRTGCAQSIACHGQAAQQV
jgi:hypothetical protein